MGFSLENTSKILKHNFMLTLNIIKSKKNLKWNLKISNYFRRWMYLINFSSLLYLFLPRLRVAIVLRHCSQPLWWAIIFKISPEQFFFVAIRDFLAFPLRLELSFLCSKKQHLFYQSVPNFDLSRMARLEEIHFRIRLMLKISLKQLLEGITVL